MTAPISSINLFQNTSALLRGIAIWMLFLICNSVNSQSFPLEGKAYSLDDIDVEGINIFNLSANQGTITDTEGNFRISASKGDTLSISAIHIQETTVIITDEHIADRKITINLGEKMNELATVTLRRGLTGYLGTDINLIPTTEPITAFSLGIISVDIKPMAKEERLLYAANSGPVDAIANMISGRTKMLKNRLELMKTTALTQSVLKKFPETYFTDVLKIGKFQIYSFLFFCEEDPDYKNIAKKTTVEIMEFLGRKSEEFRVE